MTLANFARNAAALGLTATFVACASAGGHRDATPVSEQPSADAPAPDEEQRMTPLPDNFDIQGHRGARGLKPENTLPSFETALDLEVDTLELDLHLSRDGRVVIWHDAKIEAKHCTGPSGAPRAIRDLSAAQLAAFECNRNPDPDRFPDQDSEPTVLAGDDYSIITLDDLFTFVEAYAESPRKTDSQRANARSVRFNIETKRKPKHPENIGDGFDGTTAGEFEREVVRVVRERDMVSRVTLQSFDHRSVWAARALEPALRFAVLEGDRDDTLAAYAERGADIWSPRSSLVTEATVAEAHRVGLAVIPWTVNDRAEMRTLAELGVDGIITDRPDILTGLRSETSEGETAK